MPTNITYQIINSSIIVNITNQDCEKVRGNLHYIVKAVCLEKWCFNKTLQNTTKYSVQNQTIKLETLYSYSNYELNVYYTRGHTSKIALSAQLKTKPYSKLNIIIVYVLLVLQ